MAEPDTVVSLSGPEGLDSQFTYQLEIMSKENMMLGLRTFFDDLETKTQRFVEETDMLKGLMSPVFRQHGLTIDNIYPDEFSGVYDRDKHQHHQHDDDDNNADVP